MPRIFAENPIREICAIRGQVLRLSVAGIRGLTGIETLRHHAQLPARPMKIPFFPLLAACAVGSSLAHAGDKVDFNYDIRPIISAKCFSCHGPDEKSRKAKLRLDLRDEALKEHEDGRTIVPGDVKASALVPRITSHGNVQSTFPIAAGFRSSRLWWRVHCFDSS